MLSKKDVFFNHVAQTSDSPFILDIDFALGMYIHDTSGKKYMDLDSGFSVSSIGHRHPAIVEAIKIQADKYLHTSVYGEHIQSPQTIFAEKLVSHLNCSLNNIFFANGGAEAIEIAIKCARKYTGRHEVIACKNAYHGSTLAAESLRSDTCHTMHFAPLIPGVRHIAFNRYEDLMHITRHTAAVIVEPVQAEAGVILPRQNYLNALKEKCNDTDTLLIFDEIQTGFGRTGSMFAFQKYNVEPDILCLGKAMGGGVPIAATVSNQKILSALTQNPTLGHTNTFGGNPLTTAAAVANLDVLLQSNLIKQVQQKGDRFAQLLRHDHIKEVRYDGLLMAIELHHSETVGKVIFDLKDKGYLVNFFLFNPLSIRISPPLIIGESQIEDACNAIISSIETMA